MPTTIGRFGCFVDRIIYGLNIARFHFRFSPHWRQYHGHRDTQPDSGTAATDTLYSTILSARASTKAAQPI